MRICGIDLKSSDAIVVVIDGTKDDFQIIDTGVQKITLEDTNNSSSIKVFSDVFQKFIKIHSIDKIAVKKRQTKGKFAGGAISFKMEGIIQLSMDATIDLLASTSVSKVIKTNPPPEAKLFAYQQSAYETAYTLLQTL